MEERAGNRNVRLNVVGRGAPPIEPMLAKPTPAIPDGSGWIYEPKWDGFRAIVFRDRERVYIQSRDLRPLDRYFPELDEASRGRPESLTRRAAPFHKEDAPPPNHDGAHAHPRQLPVSAAPLSRPFAHDDPLPRRQQGSCDPD